MIIQQHEDYRLDVKLTWIDQSELRLQMVPSAPSLDFTPHEYFLSPAELLQLADYIRDTLAV